MENKKKVIFGFAGRKRSGKGVLADFMVEKYGATKITIASYLKKLCADLLGMSVDEMNEKKDNGTVLDIPFKDEWCQRIAEAAEIELNKVKELCDGVVIKDVRHFLQFVGTDVIRKYVPDWHIAQAIKDIQQTDNEVFAVDDVRFPNELKGIREIGGIVFFVTRPSQMDVSNHPSETSIDPTEFIYAGSIIINDTPTVKEFTDGFTEFCDFCVDWVRTHEATPDPMEPYPYEVFEKSIWAVSADFGKTHKTHKHFSAWSCDNMNGRAIDAVARHRLYPDSRPDPLVLDIASQMKDNCKDGILTYIYPTGSRIETSNYAIEYFGVCEDCGDGTSKCVIDHPLYIEFLKYYMK